MSQELKEKKLVEEQNQSNDKELKLQLRDKDTILQDKECELRVQKVQNIEQGDTLNTEIAEKNHVVVSVEKRLEYQEELSRQYYSDLITVEKELENNNRLFNYKYKQLTTWMKQLNEAFQLLTASRRWKFSQVAGRIYQALRLRSKGSTVIDQIQDIFERFEQSCHHVDDTPLQHKRDGHFEGKLLKSDNAFVRKDDGMKKAFYTSQANVHAYNKKSTADIIICVHNALDDVKLCLESVMRYTDLNRHHLIIVDDGSEAETKKLVINFVIQLKATYIRNKNSLGYTKSANQGIKVANNEFVVLLNSDTVVTQNWLDRLISCAGSRPNIACVGPLSNAASWQTIPILTDKSGKWMVNEIPGGLSVDHYSRQIAAHSPLLYPDTNFVNGFCILITRNALDRVGFLDEDSFPRGYGEEDDFCLRALQVGFKHAVADDCYVFHAKSKSFTSHGRMAIVEKSKKKLDEKYSRKYIRKLVSQTKDNEQLLIARTWAKLAGSHPTIKHSPNMKERGKGIKIGWLQPHLRRTGGIRRTIEMSNRLLSWGYDIILITPDGFQDGWLPTLVDVKTVKQAKKISFDILILSDPDMNKYFIDLEAAHRINYHLAAYMLYRPKDRNLTAYYKIDSSVIHVANSSWTAEQARSHYGIEMSGIFPGGIDKRLFRPHRMDKLFDVVCYGSLRPHKGTKDIEIASQQLKLLRLADLNLPQQEIARHICSSKIFVSGCWHEGFNFCPLEAMACGTPVVMTDCGGSREYAINGENALVVPPKDSKAMAEAIQMLNENSSLRLKLIENGLETAWQYGWDSITLNFSEFIHDYISKAQ